MKKLLLIGAALLTATSMMAQVEGTDITPANYMFNSATTIPVLPKVNLTANFEAPVWTNQNGAEYWNNGLIGACTGGGMNATQAETFWDYFSLVDLGGEVGKVFCFIGQEIKDSFKDLLLEKYPDASFENVPTQTVWIGNANLNFFTDPNNTPTEKDGYIHFSMVINAYYSDYSSTVNVFKDIYQATNQNDNNTKVNGENFNESTTASAITNVDFIERYDDGDPVEDEEGNYVWDPTKWMVYEYDFNVPDADGDKIYTPARMKMSSPAGNNWNKAAFFIKEITFTQCTGTPQIVKERKKEYVTLTPAPKGDVLAGKTSGVESAVVAPVKEDGRIFNLQGIEVSNTNTPGIYIQNGKKFVVK